MFRKKPNPPIQPIHTPPYWMALRELYALREIVRLYANHKEACKCFICRTLTDKQRSALAEARESSWWQDGRS